MQSRRRRFVVAAEVANGIGSLSGSEMSNLFADMEHVSWLAS